MTQLTGRQDRRRLDRARARRDRRPARRPRHDHVRERRRPRGAEGLRAVRQAVRLAVDPPRCRGDRGCSRSRCSPLLGLLAALFVPRRRLWVKVTPDGHTLRIEYAGLARGEDPTIGAALDQFAQRHGDAASRPLLRGADHRRRRVARRARLAGFAARRLRPCPAPSRSTRSPCSWSGRRSRSTPSRSSRTRSISRRRGERAADAAGCRDPRARTRLGRRGRAVRRRRTRVRPRSPGREANTLLRDEERAAEAAFQRVRRPPAAGLGAHRHVADGARDSSSTSPETSPAASPPGACRGRTCTSSR